MSAIYTHPGDMQVRHYAPISEENVRELLDDIRQGIAIYLDENGLAGIEGQREGTRKLPTAADVSGILCDEPTDCTSKGKP